MRPLVLALPVLVALAAVPRATSAQEVQGRKDRVFTLNEKVADGGTVRIFSAIGDIAITEGTGATLSFRAEKDGDIEDIGYVVLRGREGITICAVRSDDDDCTSDGVHQNRSWRDRDNWRWRDRNRLTITVQVPRGTHLRTTSGNGRVSVAAAVADVRVSSGNGRIDVSGVQGPVTASSGNGDVSVTTIAGPVNASSGNGRIHVEMDKLAGTDDITLSSGNGRIELLAPADFSADVDASTGNGSVTTDFPVQLIGRLSPHRLRGTIGTGARRLRMSTGNGSLEIRKKMG